MPTDFPFECPISSVPFICNENNAFQGQSLGVWNRSWISVFFAWAVKRCINITIYFFSRSKHEKYCTPWSITIPTLNFFKCRFTPLCQGHIYIVLVVCYRNHMYVSRILNFCSKTNVILYYNSVQITIEIMWCCVMY